MICVLSFFSSCSAAAVSLFDGLRARCCLKMRKLLACVGLLVDYCCLFPKGISES